MAYLMTAAEFIEMAKKIEKTETAYMWGTYGRKITLALINAKVKQYRARYSAAYIEKLKKLIGKAFGWDCCGLIKGILWGWDGVKNVPYSVNGVPDTNVMGFYQRGENKSSDFSKIVPGAAVHLQTHVGIYIGNGLVIEATSAWESRVMITALANTGGVAGYRSRRWDSWYTLPWVDYSDAAEPKPEPPATGEYMSYTVQKGDTPWALAVKYLGAGARYTEIMQASGLKNDATIYVGQILKIPVKGGTAPPPTEPPTAITHTVVKGDTPWGLAVEYLGSGAQYVEIMALNGLKQDANIYVGQVLKIPAKAGTTPPPPPPVFQSYTGKVNTPNGLNVRSGAGMNYPVLRVLGNGTTVQITKEQSGWGYIEELKGWVSLDFIKKA